MDWVESVLPFQYYFDRWDYHLWKQQGLRGRDMICRARRAIRRLAVRLSEPRFADLYMFPRASGQF